MEKKNKIYPCIIGLGYVGLPVFLNISKKFTCVGFDLNKKRVSSLNKKDDYNKEFLKKDLVYRNNSIVTADERKLALCNFYIVTVPTPINKNKKPDLSYVIRAFKLISKYIKENDIVFLESTVFPGTTENICLPILNSKRKNFKIDIGYSSERVNPGDKKHSIEKINKVVAFKSNEFTQKQKVHKIYKLISKNIFYTKNIKNAEMSKLLENTQRDLNIAFINEILILCTKLKLDFYEVLKLASTKWNFLKFYPGLVGGHCLPVDPYYLSHIAGKNNINLSITLAGRKINEQMVNFILNLILKKLKNKMNKKILVAGLTYKQNTSDIRNSLALKIFQKLKNKIKKIEAFDPLINKKTLKINKLKNKINSIKNYDIVIFLVNHSDFIELLPSIKSNKIEIIDIFNFFRNKKK